MSLGEKMKTRILSSLVGLLLALFYQSANATIELYEWSYNVDGNTYDSFNGDTAPTSGTLDSSGLGSLTYTFSDAGMHNFIAFYDFSIYQNIDVYYDEYGTASGSLAAGQSWEIDEPGYVFGDIYDNLLAGTLDNSNAIPSSSPDDVSFAMGWNFNLNAGETATITMNLADVLPTTLPGFYLSQYDTSLPDSIHFWSTLDIAGPVGSVPEPGSLAIMGIGLIVLGFARKKRCTHKADC